MATATVAKRSTGVPEGYVEHIRPITKRSIEVRKAYASGALKKRTRTRRKLSPEEAKAQSDATLAALNL